MAANRLKVAADVADAILTASDMGPADRVALRAGRTGEERDLGGLNRDALIRVIAEALPLPESK